MKSIIATIGVLLSSRIPLRLLGVIDVKVLTIAVSFAQTKLSCNFHVTTGSI